MTTAASRIDTPKPTSAEVLARIAYERIMVTYRRYSGEAIPCYACGLQGVPAHECEHPPNWMNHVEHILRRSSFEHWPRGQDVNASFTGGAEDFRIRLRIQPEIRIEASRQGCPSVMRARVEFRDHHWQSFSALAEGVDHTELAFVCDDIIETWDQHGQLPPPLSYIR